MPAADLTLPGFYGKLPATGDFVGRRLPFDFVQRFDAWMARHLAPLIGDPAWPAGLPLRFLAGPAASFGPAAGIVLPSADKVGRRFPLGLAVVLPAAPLALTRAESWFAALAEAGLEATDGRLVADELEMRLADLPAPDVPADGELVETMVIWTERSDLYDIDPDDPLEVLESMLAASDTKADEAEHVR